MEDSNDVAADYALLFIPLYLSVEANYLEDYDFNSLPPHTKERF